LAEEKGALENKNDNYFGIKFECYKIKYFEMYAEGILLQNLILLMYVI
jgi:hypothetical protein